MLKEQIYTGTDIAVILREIQRAQDVINRIKEMRQGMMGSALISIMNEVRYRTQLHISLDMQKLEIAIFLSIILCQLPLITACWKYSLKLQDFQRKKLNNLLFKSDSHTNSSRLRNGITYIRTLPSYWHIVYSHYFPRQISSEVQKLPQSRFLPRPLGHDKPLKIEMPKFQPKNSVEWIQHHGLKG